MRALKRRRTAVAARSMYTPQPSGVMLWIRLVTIPERQDGTL
jgi:hypothetical protein